MPWVSAAGPMPTLAHVVSDLEPERARIGLPWDQPSLR